MKQPTTKKLTEQDMKDLVSDYLFGDLNSYEKDNFENNIEFFPEIHKEIEEFRGAFEFVNKIRYEDNIIQRSKNISIKVQSKLNKTQSKFVNFFKYFAPVLCLILLIILGKYYVSDEFIGNTLATVGIYTESNRNINNNENYANEDNLKYLNSELKPIITLSDITILMQIDNEDNITNNSNNITENNYSYQNLNNVIELINGVNSIDNHFSNFVYLKSSTTEANIINDEILDNQSLNNSIAFDYMITSLNEDELTYILNNF